jgi:hypothetical protein
MPRADSKESNLGQTMVRECHSNLRPSTGPSTRSYISRSVSLRVWQRPASPLKVPGCMRERVCGPPIECALAPPAEDNGGRRHGVAWPSEWASGHWEEDAA